MNNDQHHHHAARPIIVASSSSPTSIRCWMVLLVGISIFLSISSIGFTDTAVLLEYYYYANNGDGIVIVDRETDATKIFAQFHFEHDAHHRTS